MPRYGSTALSSTSSLLSLILGPSATKWPRSRLGVRRTVAPLKDSIHLLIRRRQGGQLLAASSISQVTRVRLSLSSKLLLETVTDVFLIGRSCWMEERSLSLRLWGRRAPSDIRGIQREGRRTCHSPSRGGGALRGEVTHIEMPPGAVRYLALAPSASNAL